MGNWPSEVQDNEGEGARRQMGLGPTPAPAPPGCPLPCSFSFLPNPFLLHRILELESNFRVPLIFPGRSLKLSKGKELVQGHREQRWTEPTDGLDLPTPSPLLFPLSLGGAPPFLAEDQGQWRGNNSGFQITAIGFKSELSQVLAVGSWVSPFTFVRPGFFIYKRSQSALGPCDCSVYWKLIMNRVQIQCVSTQGAGLPSLGQGVLEPQERPVIPQRRALCSRMQ